jgi:hypothetical protein
VRVLLFWQDGEKGVRRANGGFRRIVRVADLLKVLCFWWIGMWRFKGSSE